MNTEPSASFLRPLRRLLLLLAVLSLFGSVGPATHLDRVALFALYNATNGDDWTRNGGWKTASGVFSPPGTECSWFGIDCDDEDRVLDVKLRNNNLTGRIPAELGLLTGVRELDLGENRIEGEIPPELANMTSLEELELDDNRLTGGIPPELGRLPRLRDLDLDNNELNGSIPPELGQLAATMVDIDIDHNRFCGEIPPELGNLVRLRFLHLDDNRLTGTIPETFANLTELRELELAGNKLEGPIPPGLRNLGTLEVEGPEREGGLDLRRNRLFIDPALDPDESMQLNVFLNERQQGSDWSATQTVAPSNVRAEATSDSVRILWDPIAFV